MQDCIFCKIVAGRIPSTKVYEDETVLAFLDIAPVSKGHILLVPKKHYETVLDIPDDAIKKMSLALKKISGALKTGVSADGISISMSNYPAAGQVVPHAHFHLIPRFSKDGLKMWPQGKYLEGEMQKFREKIVSFL